MATMAKQVVLERTPAIKGAKILAIRPMTDKEATSEGFETGGRHGGQTMVLELSNGMVIYALADEEGNGPGVLVARMVRTGESIYVTQEP
jgi:hypothetical protein